MNSVIERSIVCYVSEKCILYDITNSDSINNNLYICTDTHLTTIL